MKDGICPKCESKEIYIIDGSRTGVTIPIGMLSTSAFVAMYVCIKCGCVEFYVEDQAICKESLRNGKNIKKVKL